MANQIEPECCLFAIPHLSFLACFVVIHGHNLQGAHFISSTSNAPSRLAEGCGRGRRIIIAPYLYCAPLRLRSKRNPEQHLFLFASGFWRKHVRVLCLVLGYHASGCCCFVILVIVYSVVGFYAFFIGFCLTWWTILVDLSSADQLVTVHETSAHVRSD